MKYLKTEAHKLNNSKLGIRIYNARSVLSHYMERVFPYRSRYFCKHTSKVKILKSITTQSCSSMCSLPSMY